MICEPLSFLYASRNIRNYFFVSLEEIPFSIRSTPSSWKCNASHLIQTRSLVAKKYPQNSDRLCQYCRWNDKLVRVNVLNGDEKWIYIHVEVQGTKQAEFAKRMFVYNYRIFDRYDRPVASLAVLADTHKQWKPTSYGFSVLGCKLSLEFPVAKLTDYEEGLDELLESSKSRLFTFKT